MNKAVLLVAVVLSLMMIPAIAGDMEAKSQFTDEYVVVTYYVDDQVMMVTGLVKGTAVGYIPPLPEGYSAWDVDLTQPIYKDTDVHAIPEEPPIPWLYIFIGVVAVLTGVACIYGMRP